MLSDTELTVSAAASDLQQARTTLQRLLAAHRAGTVEEADGSPTTTSASRHTAGPSNR